MKINLLTKNKQNLVLPRQVLQDLFSVCTLAFFRQKKFYEEFKKKGIDFSLEVILVDGQTIKKINQQHRNIDQETDVLSFPNLFENEFFKEYTEAEWAAFKQEAEFEEGHLHFGSIILNLEKAKSQAEEYGHSILREVAFLYVHSLLHLCGYDHKDSDSAQVMEELQEELLVQLGFLRSYPEADLLNHLAALWPKMEELIQEEKQNFSFEWLTEDDEYLEEALLLTGDEDEQNDFSLDGESDLNSDLFSTEKLRVGFVTICGKANAGKSTLLNTLSGVALAIVSQKAQTTRHNIKAVYDDNESQIIFTDTPGLHQAKTKLGTIMNESVWQSLEQADSIVLLMDATTLKLGEFEKELLENIGQLKKRCFLVINKCDVVKKETLLPFIEKYASLPAVESIIPISAKTREGISLLLEKIKQSLPLGNRLYPVDYFTDQTERQLAAEYIREQILHYCHDEIPHGTGVIIDKFEEIGEPNQVLLQDRKLVRIFASILVDKETHKSIVIGKNGTHLKRIGTAARISLENLLDCKVFLQLHVKVRPNWRNKKAFLDTLGYQLQNKPNKQSKQNKKSDKLSRK